MDFGHQRFCAREQRSLWRKAFFCIVREHLFDAHVRRLMTESASLQTIPGRPWTAISQITANTLPRIRLVRDDVRTRVHSHFQLRNNFELTMRLLELDPCDDVAEHIHNVLTT